MTLSITRGDPTNQSVLLVLRGALDYASAPELRATISALAARKPAPQQIVVDLRNVEHIDDTGIGTLVVSTRICRQLGIDVVVRLPAPLIRRLFRGDVPGEIGNAIVATARDG
jgi:anti-sigma B factor antagonist